MKHSIIDDILYINGQSTDIICSEAEEEFWARIQELEKLCAEKEERINQLVFCVASSLEKLTSK